jgi:phosphoribosyl-AMP cyclohydrolase / phosphoribosyl-ATP pyrophosphohydrolase
MNDDLTRRLDWEKSGGLIPAIVQDADTLQVLMLGFMSPEALEATMREGKVTFHSRSRGRLWQKGATSGNHLTLQSIEADCDGDTLLVMAMPHGPTCHLGATSCFTAGPSGVGWLAKLARIVRHRAKTEPENSYTAHLLSQGPVRVAQKIGEEGVELALAAAALDKEACVAEAADLLFHLIVLMEMRGFNWRDVAAELEHRTGADLR